MGKGLQGQVALLTGPTTHLSLAVARRLANEGVRLVFAGPMASDDPVYRSLADQFRRGVICFVTDLADTQTVQEIVDAVERTCGRVDMLIHTLGGGNAAFELFGDFYTGGDSMIRRSAAPLATALTCTSGAMRHMARRGHGHILHLVTRADVGAMEVERLALTRLQQTWERDGVPSNVLMSTVYFADTAMLPPAESTVGDTRLLERFSARLVEEEDWAARVLLQDQIGDTIVRICAQTRPNAPGMVRAFDCPGSDASMLPMVA